MRQNRDRVELQSSLAAAKRSVRDSSPDRQAAAAATSEPAIAAMPATSASHCLRSVGKFSLAVDPTRLTQWQYRTMTQDNPMHLATRRAAAVRGHAASAGALPGLPPVVGSAATKSKRPPPLFNAARPKLSAAEQAEALAAVPFRERLADRLREVDGVSAQFLSLVKRGEWYYEKR